MNKINFTIEGMHCNGCANTVKNVLQQIEGSSEVKVNFETATASLLSKYPIKINAINKALVVYGDFKLMAIN